MLDAWKEKQAQNYLLTASLKKHVADLNERRERLEEAFIEEKSIDRETYQRRRDKLNEEIVLAEIQERDAELVGYDLEAVLNFAEQVILNADRLWTECSCEQKQRLQKVIFPNGLNFANGVYGTAEIGPIFKLIQGNEDEKTRMATLPGIEPGLPP